MRLVDVLDICKAKLVEVTPETSLAEASQAMCAAEAAGALIIRPDGRQEILTRADIIRLLTMSASPLGAWQGPVIEAIVDSSEPIDPEMPVGLVIANMGKAGSEYRPVVTERGLVIISLCNLLMAENAFLHSEVQHLQTYIDALHDAPND